MEIFSATDNETMEVGLGDSEIIQGFLDCEDFAWDKLVNWSEVSNNKLLQRDDFASNDIEKAILELEDDEIIQGFLDCEALDWDESMFDHIKDQF